MKRFISLLLISVLCITLFSSCREQDLKISDSLIKELKFLNTNTVELEVGKTDRSYFTVEGPEDFSIDDIQFISSDEDVVTFTYDRTALDSYVYYIITAVAPGSATVYVQTVDGVVKTEEITVNVVEETTSGFTYTPIGEKETETTTEAADLSKMSIKERIEYAAHNAFEDNEVEVVYAEHTKYSTIKVSYSSILSIKLETKSAQMSIYETLKAIADIADFTVSFSITFPSTDDYGNSHQIKVISAEFFPETRNKINWEGFDWRKVDDIADKFNANSQIEEYIE